MPIRTFGYQPLHEVLANQQITHLQASIDLGVSYRHLRNVMCGRTFPMDILREKLPVYLGVPLEDLFTEEVLSHSYDPRFNTRGKK